MILTDCKTSQLPVEIVSQACLEITSLVRVDYSLPVSLEKDIPLRFHESMIKSDVIILLASQSWYQAPFRRKIKYEFGKRIIESYNLDEEVLKEGGLLADYARVAAITQKVNTKVKGKKTIRIITSKGTDFKAEIISSGFETGLYSKPPTGGNLPAGEVAILPQNTSGKIVFDVIADKLGRLDNLKTKVTVEKNYVKDFSSDLKIFFKDDRRIFNIAEIALGTNSWCKERTGNVLEAEKRLGAAHLGFGNNTYFGGKVRGPHLDAVFARPTIFVDEQLIMVDGILI